MNVRLKRVHESASPEDGRRILVDRLWPRGVRKDDGKVDRWMKELGPSHELRKWFDHDPVRFAAFKTRYFTELEANDEAVQALRAELANGPVTLLFSARDPDHNNAVVLKAFLESGRP